MRLDAVVYLPADDVALLVNRFRTGEVHVVGWPGFPTLLAEGTAAQRLMRARAMLQSARARERLGRPLQLRVPSGNGEELCLAVASMWTAAGLPTVTVRSEIRSLIADLRRSDFDVALTGAQEPPALEAYLERFRAGSSYNTGRYAGRDFEALFAQALRIADPAARAAAMTSAEIRLAADHPVVPLIQEVARNLVAASVVGWVDNIEDLHLSRYLGLRGARARAARVE